MLRWVSRLQSGKTVNFLRMLLVTNEGDQKAGGGKTALMVRDGVLQPKSAQMRNVSGKFIGPGGALQTYPVIPLHPETAFHPHGRSLEKLGARNWVFPLREGGPSWDTEVLSRSGEAVCLRYYPTDVGKPIVGTLDGKPR